MSAAYLVFDRRIPGDDSPVRLLGKALVRNIGPLREIAAERNLYSVVLCFSLSEREFRRRSIALANGEDAPPATMIWHDPSDGLATFRALADHLRANPLAVDDPDAVLTDLKQCAAYLELADGHEVAFHLERGDEL